MGRSGIAEPILHKSSTDRTLRDVMKSTKVFGEITVILGGEFRQTLLVIQKGCQEQIAGESFSRMKLWVFDRNLSALSNCVPMNTQCWDSQKQQKIYQLFSAIFSMSVTRDWL